MCVSFSCTLSSAASTTPLPPGSVVGVRRDAGWTLAQVENSNRHSATLVAVSGVEPASHGFAPWEAHLPVTAVRSNPQTVASYWLYPQAALHVRGLGHGKVLSAEQFAAMERQAGPRPTRISKSIIHILAKPRPLHVDALVERYEAVIHAAEVLITKVIRESWIAYSEKMLSQLKVAKPDRCLHADVVLDAPKRARRVRPLREYLQQLKDAEDELQTSIEEHARTKKIYRDFLFKEHQLPEALRKTPAQLERRDEQLARVHVTAGQMTRQYNGVYRRLEALQADGLFVKPAALRECYPYFFYYEPDLNVRDQGIEGLM